MTRACRVPCELERDRRAHALRSRLFICADAEAAASALDAKTRWLATLAAAHGYRK